MSEVVATYSDGGLIRVNPSPIGGMWAFCHVNAAGERVASGSGIVLSVPGDEYLSLVTNNQSEFRAMLAGLEALPDGWSGTVYSDSLVTIRRFRDDGAMHGIPLDWKRRAAMTLGRLGRLEFVLLDGHPSRAQLAAGVGKRGNPVSEHNVFCDQECTRIGREYTGVEKPKRAKKGAAA